MLMLTPQSAAIEEQPRGEKPAAGATTSNMHKVRAGLGWPFGTHCRCRRIRAHPGWGLAVGAGVPTALGGFRAILEHLGLPTALARLAPARGHHRPRGVELKAVTLSTFRGHCEPTAMAGVCPGRVARPVYRRSGLPFWRRSDANLCLSVPAINRGASTAYAALTESLL